MVKTTWTPIANTNGKIELEEVEWTIIFIVKYNFVSVFSLQPGRNAASSQDGHETPANVLHISQNNTILNKSNLLHNFTNNRFSSSLLTWADSIAERYVVSMGGRSLG